MNQQEIEALIGRIALGNPKVAQICVRLNGFYGPGLLVTLESLCLSPEEIWKQFDSECHGRLLLFHEWLTEDLHPEIRGRSKQS